MAGTSKQAHELHKSAKMEVEADEAPALARAARLPDVRERDLPEKPLVTPEFLSVKRFGPDVGPI